MVPALSNNSTISIYFFFMTLLDIGDDLLCTIIPQFLSPSDIFNFSIINKEIYEKYYNSPFTSTLYRILYNKKFNETVTDSWQELFHLRVNKSQQVFTWGTNEFGRLGYLLDTLPSSSLTSRRGVHTPSNISTFNNNIITNISSTGYSFIILTNNGQLFYTGHDYSHGLYRQPEPPGPSQKDYYPSFREENNTSVDNLIGNRYDRVVTLPPVRRGGFPIPIRRGGGVRLPGEFPDRSGGEVRIQPILTRPPEEFPDRFPTTGSSLIKETNFVTKFNIDEKVRIVAVSSGRQHILALDDKNEIYTWDTGVQNKMGIKIKFKSLVASPIVKIFAGWNLSAIYVYNIGIIIWNSREILTKEKFDTKDFSVYANHQILKGTEKIKDFSLGDNFVIFTTKNGELFRADVFEGTVGIPYPVEAFNNWLTEKHHSTGELIKFTKLNCCFKNYVVFTDNDQILLGNDKNEINLIEQLQFQNIKSIEIGDYHFLALTKNGEVLSWGSESKDCGCLGLGSKESVLEKNSSDIVRNLGLYDGIKVNQPLKVVQPGPGKFVQITASGWHSGAIFIPEKEEM